MTDQAAVQSQGAPPEEITQAIEAAKTAASFQDAADSLRKQASAVFDPVERERLLKSAYAKEKEAHGESKKARAMASGWGQGAGFGVGISAAVGMGAGNLVGALLSGIVAVPGALIGSGVGAIHGPFVKLKDMVSGNGETAGDGASDDNLVKQSEPAETNVDEDDDEKRHIAIVEAAREIEGHDSSNDESGGSTASNAAEDAGHNS